MRFVSLFVFLLLCKICWAQNDLKYPEPILPIRIEFEVQHPNEHNYFIREEGDSSIETHPLYVSLSYDQEEKFIHYEFFRIDTAHYLVREYFKGNDSYTGGGLKSYGLEIIAKKIDSVAIPVYDASGEKIRSRIGYVRRLEKNGEWIEIEDIGSSPIFWKGKYANNKKIGVWTRALSTTYSLTENATPLEEINYDKDSTKINYYDNGLSAMSTDELKKLMDGRWMIWSCNQSGIVWCEKEGWRYKVDDYKNYPSYQFDSSGKLLVRMGGDCKPIAKYFIKGYWQLKRDGRKAFIEINYANGIRYKIELIYYKKAEDLAIKLERLRSRI